MSHLLSIDNFCVENQLYKKGGSLSLTWVAGVASLSALLLKICNKKQEILSRYFH
jgi:hypothetical protein